MSNEQSGSLWQEAMAMFESMADTIGLEDDERQSFISASMKRKGFREVTTWADPEDKDKNDKGGGDFFSQRRQERTREVGGGRGGNGWSHQYGS